MNIQRITSDWLLKSGLEGDELLLEALLRRGFLAYRDNQGVWLGTGSHRDDLNVLQFIDGLEVIPANLHQNQMALIKIDSDCSVSLENIALSIINLPGNYGMTGYGVGGRYIKETWMQYRYMVWGAKMAVCPMREKGQQKVNNALDLGVALLVKTFSLARVATALSCDGHGDKHACINLYYLWDASWSRCVFDTLCFQPTNSNWTWESTYDSILQRHESNLQIAPSGGFDDVAVKAMLDDIQYFSRQLLNQSTIDKIGFARAKTLEIFGANTPRPKQFADEARRQLGEEFC